MQELIEALKLLIELRQICSTDTKPTIDKAIEAVSSAIGELARNKSTPVYLPTYVPPPNPWPTEPIPVTLYQTTTTGAEK